MTRLLPEILAERGAGERIELDLRVPPDLAYFDGHFPGMPILPGVVQIDWSIRLGQERLPLRGGFVAAEQLKFLSIIRPDMLLTLFLQINTQGERLSFSYTGKEKKYSSGTLVFGAP